MVFAAFTQHCMQSTDFMSEMSKILCIQWPLAPPGGKARCSHPSCGFSGSPPCSPRRQLCLKIFWDLSNYKGDCRQDAQPIPNS